MNFLVLGATGQTGGEIIGQALARGHRITALARSPERIRITSDRLVPLKGNLLNSTDLKAVLPGHDAVLSTFGPRTTGEKTRKQFALALTDAMASTEIRRLVLLSSAFLFNTVRTIIVGRLFFREIVVEHVLMEEVVAKSSLDWTIVRPPRLTNGQFTKNYRIRENQLPSFGFSISRAAVADFMLHSAEKHAYLRQVMGISN